MKNNGDTATEQLAKQNKTKKATRDTVVDHFDYTNHIIAKQFRCNVREANEDGVLLEQ